MSKPQRAGRAGRRAVDSRSEAESWVSRFPQWLAVLLLGAIGVAIWYVFALLEIVPRILFPGPTETFHELVLSARNIASAGHVAGALWVTIQEVLWGFAAAAALGFALGVIVGETQLGRKAVMPFLVAFNALPKVAFAPVFVAWWGFGLESKIAMALFLAFFPVVVNTAAGLGASERESLMLFRSLGASRLQALWKLKLPQALPYIFSGLKSAAVFAVVGAVVGEYLGGGGGLGELIRLSAQYLNLARVFALIFWLGLLGMALFSLVGWVERRVIFWRHTDHADQFPT